MLRRLIILLLIVGCEEPLEPQDCAGVAGGNTVFDDCGVCYESEDDANLNIIQEHDEYNNIDMKEQALVLSYLKDLDNIDESGLDTSSIGLIKHSYDLANDKALSYFAYESMKMYIFGGDPECYPNCGWFLTDTSSVDFLFRFGKEEMMIIMKFVSLFMKVGMEEIMLT